MKETLGVAIFVWKVAVTVIQVGAQFGAEDNNSGFGKSASLGSDPIGEYGNNRFGYGLDNSNYIDGSNYPGSDNFGGSSQYSGGFPSYSVKTNDQPYLSPDGNNYEFNYKVNYGDQYFGHEEVRVGDVVMGRYFVLLPDGRVQEVTYVADQNGYRATVNYTAFKAYSSEVPSPPYNRRVNQVPGDA